MKNLTLLLFAIAAPMLPLLAQHPESAANKYMHKHDFDELVARFEAPDRAEWQKPDKVIELLGPLEGRTVADIGAGTGYFTFQIAPKATRVLAIDIDPRFIAHIDAKENPKVETRLTNADSPGLGKGEADVVLIVNTYHHIDDRIAYLKKLRSSLPPDGMLMIVDFKKQETPHGPPIGIRLAQDEAERELKSAGFTIELSDRETLPEQYILKARP